MMTRLKKLIDKVNCKPITYNLKKVELIIAETLKMLLSPWRVHLVVRIPDFHSGHTVSITVHATNNSEIHSSAVVH